MHKKKVGRPFLSALHLVIEARQGERLKDCYRLEFTFNSIKNLEIVSTLRITTDLKILNWFRVSLELENVFYILI